MSWYCSADCQKKDWKTHKKCCKKLKRGVDLVLGTGKRKLVPYPLVEQTGFEEAYIESKNQLPDGVRDYDHDYAWEYHGTDDKDPTKRVWKKYPPLINYCIESVREAGIPRYFYRPNDHEKEGLWGPAPFRRPAPPNVSTRFIFFGCMMECDVYTGAARAVRRIGVEPTEPTQMKELGNLMRDFEFHDGCERE